MKQKTEKAGNADIQEAKNEQPEAAPEAVAEAPAESGPDTAGTDDQEAAAPLTVDWEAVSKEQEKLIRDMTDRYQRSLAEFDNYRKRTIKEKATVYNDGVGDTVEKLLPVVDNFERALAVSDDKENGLYKGLEMTFRQLSDILQKMGVEAVPGEGEPFSPNMHHAVAHVEDKSLGEGVVAEVLLKGYKYRDRVLRPGMVKVAN